MSMTLASIASSFDHMQQSVQDNLWFVCSLTLIALAVFIINSCMSNRLNNLGILPRSVQGIPGILFAPWLHASLSHWLINALFFLLLASMALMLMSHTHFLRLCLILSLGSGLLTWIAGRRALHIGASGVVMGLWGYLVVYAFSHPSLVAIAVAIMVIYFLGGMVMNIIPKNDKSSWEAHLFGAITGMIAAILGY